MDSLVGSLRSLNFRLYFLPLQLIELLILKQYSYGSNESY
jgi:hypothetical protein